MILSWQELGNEVILQWPTSVVHNPVDGSITILDEGVIFVLSREGVVYPLAIGDCSNIEKERYLSNLCLNLDLILIGLYSGVSFFCIILYRTSISIDFSCEDILNYFPKALSYSPMGDLFIVALRNEEQQEVDKINLSSRMQRDVILRLDQFDRKLNTFHATESRNHWISDLEVLENDDTLIW